MNFLNRSTHVLDYLTQLWYVCDSIALTARKKNKWSNDVICIILCILFCDIFHNINVARINNLSYDKNHSY
jgi:hypothetical protein